ncbi:MAG: hypothetical protein JJT75_08155 [Opitutales bacterium]|nr:hypothetical protein [Opitutales bacterium]MCH8539704.1 hypothetical protein [Opitutales bacterium]
MDWQIKSFTRKCFLTGRSFSDGDQYISMLIDRGHKGELERLDFLAGKENDFSPLGKILCRWQRQYQRSPVKNDGDEQRKTAEHLFFSLYENLPASAGEEEESLESKGGSENEGEESEDLLIDEEGREALKQILGLLLERKKVFKTVGYTPNQSHQILEHRQMGEVFLVPAGELSPETMVHVQKRLEGLVLKPK